MALYVFISSKYEMVSFITLLEVPDLYDKKKDFYNI